MTRGPVLHGEMVQLRPIEARDADRMWESVQDPELRRLTGTTATFERAQIDEWAATISDRPGRYDWAVTSGAGRDSGATEAMIGEIVLNEIDSHARSANIRLALLPSFRGRGYGRDAISQVLGFAFDGADGPRLHRVGLDVLTINPRARMLYQSLGFVEEGHLRDVYLDGQSWVDAVVMSILEDEFRTGA